jgi:tetratricopeptide (TPR) repeat protein
MSVMNITIRPAVIAVILPFAGGACVHTPPGTSVEVVLARKGQLVKLPAPQPPPSSRSAATGGQVPAVEPPMPQQNALVENVGDAFSRGMFCLRAERDLEAITAFEEAVKLDPSFTDAWQNLALLYEKTGEEKKALEAFKKAKKLARQ